MQRQPDMPDHRLFRRPPVGIRTRGHLHLEPFDVKYQAEGVVEGVGFEPGRSLASGRLVASAE